MSSTPYAKLLVSLNAGPIVSGGITAANGDSVQLSAESTAQWDLTTPPRWEIYAYPPGWPGPAAGWTTESVPQPGGGTADVYVFLGLGPPPAFTLPALPTWGKFLMRLTVAGGLLNGLPAAQLVDDSTGIQIVGPNGLFDIAVTEEGQFDSARAWVGAWQDSLRILDAALVGAATPYLVLPSSIQIGAGSFGAVNQYARGDHTHPVSVGSPSAITVGAVSSDGVGPLLAAADHTHPFTAPVAVATVSAAAGVVGVGTAAAREDHAHQVSVGSPVNVGTANSDGVSTSLARADHVHALSFATLNSILATASAPITINGQTLTSGGLIAPYLASNTTPIATSGLVRVSNSADIVVGRDDGDSANIPVLSWGVEGTDVVGVGSSSTFGVTIHAQAASSSGIWSIVGTTTVLQMTEAVASFFIAGSAGGGTRILQIGNATAAPTSVPVSSLYAWSDTGALRALSPTNVKTVLTTSLAAGTGAGEDLRAPDRVSTRVQTVGAGATSAILFTLPPKSTARFTATFVAYSNDGPTRASWEIRGASGRLGAAAASALGTHTTESAKDAGAAAWNASVTENANDIDVRIAGDVGFTVEWFVTLDVTLIALP